MSHPSAPPSEQVSSAPSEVLRNGGAPPQDAPPSSAPPPGQPAAVAQLHTTPGGVGSAEPAPPSPATPVDRAEELADRIAFQVATFTAAFGKKLVRLVSRAREEAEDIWAEAQNIRQGKQP